MAVPTNRVGTAWHYGERISGTGWTTPAAAPNNYVYTGSFTGNPAVNRQIARQTFSGVQRIDTIGALVSFRIYVDTLNGSANGGALYVSSAALQPNQVIASAKKVGDWATVDGTPVWITPSNQSVANFLSAIGSATTWYAYWDNNVTASRSLFYANVHPTWEISSNPGMVRVNAAGTWKTGQPRINVAGTWKTGMAYINVSGTWKIGV